MRYGSSSGAATSRSTPTLAGGGVARGSGRVGSSGGSSGGGGVDTNPGAALTARMANRTPVRRWQARECHINRRPDRPTLPRGVTQSYWTSSCAPRPSGCSRASSRSRPRSTADPRGLRPAASRRPTRPPPPTRAQRPARGVAAAATSSTSPGPTASRRACGRSSPSASATRGVARPMPQTRPPLRGDTAVA